MTDDTRPLGVLLNNPGDLVDAGIAWDGMVAGGSVDGFCRFLDPRWGIRALAKNLLAFWHMDVKTVEAIVTKWAPPAQNDTAAYVRDVCAWTGFLPQQPLDLLDQATLDLLVNAIIHQEVGLGPQDRPWYPSTIASEAVLAALGARSTLGWPTT